MSEPKTVVPEKALRKRELAKKRKPKFVRPESWRYVRLKENWRNPQGLDNKVRMSIKGWPPKVSVGYRGPKVARGLHPSGRSEVLVYNLEQLRLIDNKTQAARIAHTVGKRKKIQILSEARKKKILVLNARETKEAAQKGTKEEEDLPDQTEEPKVKSDKAEKSSGAKKTGRKANAQETSMKEEHP